MKIPCIGDVGNEDLCKSRLNLKTDKNVKGPSEHNHTISN